MQVFTGMSLSHIQVGIVNGSKWCIILVVSRCTMSHGNTYSSLSDGSLNILFFVNTCAVVPGFTSSIPLYLFLPIIVPIARIFDQFVQLVTIPYGGACRHYLGHFYFCMLDRR